MYEINGRQYSLQDLQSSANDYNMSFDDYMSAMAKKGLTKVRDDKQNVSWFDQTWFGRGIAAASTTGEAMDLWKEGSDVNMKTIQEFIEAKEQEAKTHVPSKRMEEFQKQYQKEGATWSAFFRGVKRDPMLMAELFVQSLGTQFGTAIDAPEARTSAVAGGAAGAGIGAVATAYGFGIGAVPGALAGAMGGLASTMETALTFGELIEEELKKEGKEFTDKNIKALLEGPKGKSIRNKAIGRGLTIGAIEGLSGGLAGKAGIAAHKGVMGVVKTAGRGGKRAKLGAIAGGAGVEAVGGATGEVAGRAVAGQEMDPAEIGFEAITGMTTAPLNVTAAMLYHKPAVYKLNRKEVSYAEMKDFIDTAEDVDIRDANIEMENDATGLDAKAARKQNRAIIDSQIDEKITDKKDREALIDYEIERQLKELEAQKKGIDKVPDAGLELATIEAEIDAIIGKYEGAVGLYEVQTEEAKATRKIRREIGLQKTIDFLQKHKKYVGKDVVIAEDSDAAQIAHDKAVAEWNAKNPNNQLPIEDVSKSDGFIVGDVIVVNKDIAGQSGQINVGAHELLHGIIAKHMQSLVDVDVDGNIIDDSKLRKFIGDFKDTLTEEQFDYIETEIKRRIGTGEDIALDTTEEWLTIFSDGITKGDIVFNEGVFDKMKNVFQEVLRKVGIKKEFANGRQVYNFMKDYQASIEKNQLSTRAQKLAGGGVGVSGVKASMSAVGGAVEAAASYRGRGKSTITKEERDRITDNVNALGESYEVEGVGNKAWEEGGATQAIEEINENGYLDALIRAQYKADVVPKNFVKDVITELTQHIKNYKPEEQLKVDPNKRTGLFGWINAQVGNRASRVYNEIYKQKEEAKGAKDVGAVTTEGAPVVQVAAEKDIRVKQFEEEDILKSQLEEQERKKKGVKPIPKAVPKVDKIRSISDFDVELQDGSVDAEIIAQIEDLIEKNPDNIQEQFDAIIEKEFRKLLDNSIGKIAKDKKTGKVGPTAEYEIFIRKEYNEIVQSLGITTIRTAYKNWFEKKRIGTEDVKGVSSVTGKVTNFRKGIFENTTNKPKYIKYFTEGKPGVLRERRTALLKRIARRKAENAIDNYIQENSNNIDAVTKAKLRQLSKAVDNVQNEKKSFDSVKFSNSVKKEYSDILNTPGFKKIGNIYVGYTNPFNKLSQTFNDLGKVYEQAFSNYFSKMGIDGLEVVSKVASEKGGMADFIFKYFNFEENHELKVGEPSAGGPFLGSVGFSSFDYESGVITLANETHNNLITKKASSDFKKAHKKRVDSWNKDIKRLNKETKEGNLKRPIYPEITYDIVKGKPQFVPHEIYHDKKHGIKSLVQVESDASPVINHYLGKNVPAITFVGTEFGNISFNLGGSILKLPMLKLKSLIDFTYRNTGSTTKTIDGYEVKMQKVQTGLQFKATKLLSNPNEFKDITNKEQFQNEILPVKATKSISETTTLNNATKHSRSAKNPTKGITVLDFDDTLATTKSRVSWTAPDGTTGFLTAEEYARDYQGLLAQGYKFDFSEFDIITGGKTAPLFNKALKLAKKFGTENMFILTARPAAAQKAIHEFLKSQGLNIPLKNIVALGNSTSEAKALWVAEKVGEGYNDFYFADDAIQNIQAVQNMLDQFDVKSKVQQARVKFSNSMGQEFNNILEDVTGIDAKKRFSTVKARKRGSKRGRWRFFIPPSHEDFLGLLYNFMGRGKQGNAHRSFFEKALIRPLNRAFRELDLARQSIANDYKSLNKEFKNVKKKLAKKTPDGDYTYSDAIRVYLWNKFGHNIPGLSAADQKMLVDLVTTDPELQVYAETLNVISKREDYVKPTDGWNSGDIRMDLDDATGRVGRSDYFAEFLENVAIIFSEENLNKIEAAYGSNVREALEDILYRIRTGKNRPKGQNKIVNRFMNWLNASVGSVMFLNMRSAVLQQLSIVNYLNFADNNIFAAAKAFANTKQYWKDFVYIFNSDMLKQRRGGIRTDLNAAELVETLGESRFAGRVLIQKLLQLGFTPTQIGDSIAIATGGAAYYRNKINTYLKQVNEATGKKHTQKEAEAKAWTDFQNITQSTQQSARPDMISQQQASPLGKFILNFQNVTSQYNRFGKKAFSDIYNRRITPPNKTQLQSDISNASRIVYYIGVQNVIFYGLQTALFAAMFDDDDEDKKFFTKKKERLIHGTIDSVLRGTGVMGSVIATLKNMARKFAEQRKVGYNPDESSVLMEMLNVSPVVGIKARKISNAGKTLNYNKKVIKQMDTFDIDNPMWSAVTNYIEATTNAPVNRLYNKTQNVRQSLNNEHAAWQRVLMFLGWSQYNLGVEDTKMQEIKGKTKKGTSKKKKSKTTRRKFH